MRLLERHDGMLTRFEENREHLRAVAYRMLGSLDEADDALQETWLRVRLAGDDDVENPRGWLTTIVSRVCLNMLRARRTRRHEPMDPNSQAPAKEHRSDARSPEEELLLSESVGVALLVVLDRLSPAERVAFVLHDIFGTPFDEIAPIVNRTPAATRQLASRARRRVHGPADVPSADQSRHKDLVDAFLAASKAGDFDALLSLLDPDVVLRSDPVIARANAPVEVHGATAVARLQSGRARFTQTVLIAGGIGIVGAPNGRLILAVQVTITDGKISLLDAIGEPEELRRLELAVFHG